MNIQPQPGWRSCESAPQHEVSTGDATPRAVCHVSSYVRPRAAARDEPSPALFFDGLPPTHGATRAPMPRALDRFRLCLGGTLCYRAAASSGPPFVEPSDIASAPLPASRLPST